MEKYSVYNDSGIEWLGDIPEHWDIIRIKDVARIVRGGSPRPAGDAKFYGGSIPFLKVGDLTKNEQVYLKKFSSTITELGLSNTRLVKENTLLLTNSGATLGIPKITSFPTTFNDGIAAFLSLKKSLNIFLFYFLKSRTKWYLELASLGQGQPNLNTEIIANTNFAIPPLQEQTQIANYLDAKTKVIDQKINLLQQKITHYKAYRKTLINETVTKGLDKSVKLKDSGIDWLGQIPEHWEVNRLKSILRKKITDGPHETPEFTNEGYPFISVDGIQDGELTFDGCRFISESDFKRYTKKVVIEKDDLFMGKAASTGKIARVKVDLPFTVWSPIAVIKILKSINSTFVEYFLKSDVVQLQIDFLCTHNTQKNIAMKDIPRILFVFPPFNEQQQIANFLDTKTATIDKIVKNIETQISTLKELRKTLINEVVTGKVKVIK